MANPEVVAALLAEWEALSRWRRCSKPRLKPQPIRRVLAGAPADGAAQS
ncbi:hypothetical protein M8494_14480 [Serratia ureilytica]